MISAKGAISMKRIFCLLLSCILILCGCASGGEPSLKDFLAKPEGAVYRSPFGIDIELSDLSVITAADIAELSGLEGDSLEDKLTREMDKGNAVAILSATAADTSNMTMSLIPLENLPASARTAKSYAEYTAELMPEKLEGLECTNIRITRTSAFLGENEYPAVYVSCNFVDGSPYHLLQICFCEGNWMGGLSLTSLDSPAAIQELLTRVTTSTSK